jgi:hypothetical protein
LRRLARSLHNHARVHVAGARTDRMSRFCPLEACGTTVSRPGIRRGRRRCKDCRARWRDHGTRGCASAGRPGGGTATTSAASASRMSQRSPPRSSLQPRRLHLRGRLAGEAGRSSC